MRRSLFGVSVVCVALLLSGAGPARAQSHEERVFHALLDRFVKAANSTDEKLLRQDLADHSRSGDRFSRPLPPASARWPKRKQ